MNTFLNVIVYTSPFLFIIALNFFLFLKINNIDAVSNPNKTR